MRKLFEVREFKPNDKEFIFISDLLKILETDELRVKDRGLPYLRDILFLPTAGLEGRNTIFLASNEGTAHYLERRKKTMFERQGKIWRGGKEYNTVVREIIKESENGYEKEIRVEGDVNVDVFVEFEEEKVDKNKAHFEGAALYFNQKYSISISGDAWVLSLYDAWPFEYTEGECVVISHHAGRIHGEHQTWQKIVDFGGRKYFIRERGLLSHRKGFWYIKEVFLL